MPTILMEVGFHFFFYSRENAEPPHIHDLSGDKLAKYRLEPVELSNSRRLRSHELTDFRVLVVKHRSRFLEAWNEHFGA